MLLRPGGSAIGTGCMIALGLDARVPSPFDVGEYDDPVDPPRGLFASPECPAELWRRSLALRRRLIEIAGEPGGVGRHGEPLGPGKPNYHGGGQIDGD
jgi:hypothetical protein